MTATGTSPFEDEATMAYVLSILRRGLARTRAAREDANAMVEAA